MTTIERASRSVLRFKRYAGHVVLKLATLTLGAAYVSPAGERLRTLLDTRPERSRRFSGRAAIAAHVFYPDLLPEILRCHAVLPAGSALIATVPADRQAVVEAALAGVENAVVVPVANRGRDIAPFIRLLGEGRLDAYDAVLKIHTKKSPHLRDGDIRRRLLFAVLAGSKRRVDDILTLFADPATGAIGWRMAWRASERFWMANRERVDELARRMELPQPEAPAFFEGSMFWVRPAALRRMKALHLALDDFEPEAGQLDGTLHHALERVFDLAIEGEGQVTRDTKGNALGARR